MLRKKFKELYKFRYLWKRKKIKFYYKAKRRKNK